MQVFFKPEKVRQKEKKEFQLLSSEREIFSLDEKPIKQIEEELLLDKILTEGLEVPDHSTALKLFKRHAYHVVSNHNYAFRHQKRSLQVLPGLESTGSGDNLAPKKDLVLPDTDLPKPDFELQTIFEIYPVEKDDKKPLSFKDLLDD